MLWILYIEKYFTIYIVYKKLPENLSLKLKVKKIYIYLIVNYCVLHWNKWGRIYFETVFTLKQVLLNVFTKKCTI